MSLELRFASRPALVPSLYFLELTFFASRFASSPPGTSSRVRSAYIERLRTRRGLWFDPDASSMG